MVELQSENNEKNTEVVLSVIDSIIINVNEHMRRKSRNSAQRKHTTYVKRTKTQVNS